MSDIKRIHVIRRKNGWAVKRQGAKRAIKIYKLKDEAIKTAVAYRQLGFIVVVHKKDGSIEKWLKPSFPSINGQRSKPARRTAS